MSVSKAVKKALAILLSAAFAVTSLPVAAYAQTEQIEVGDMQAEEETSESSDEFPVSGNEVSGNEVSGNDVSGNKVSQNAAEEDAEQEEDNIADEDAYKGLKVISPALKRVNEDGTEECISENDVPERRSVQRTSESEYQIKIDVSRLSSASGVEISYSEPWNDSADAKKTVIWNASDGTGVKTVAVPQYAYLWVRATKVKSDAAVVMRAVRRQSNENYYVENTGCFYEAGEYAYKFIAWDNYDMFLEEDNDLKTVAYDFENHESYNINNIRVSRQDGVTVNNGDKVSASDTLNVEYTGEITGVYQLKTYFDVYNARYISNASKSVSLLMRKDENTLHIEAVPQFNVTITMPEGYENYLEFYTSEECTERLAVGEEQDNQTLESGKGIYTKVVQALPEGKRFYFDSDYYSGKTLQDGNASGNPQFLWDMPERDFKIEVTIVERKSIIIDNACPDAVGVYTIKNADTNELSGKIENGAAELMPGDKIYVRVLKDAPSDSYYVVGESNDGQYISYRSHYNIVGDNDFQLMNKDTTHILIRRENTSSAGSWTAKIENPYSKYVRFYRDENKYYELKDKDTISGSGTSIQVYAELIAPLPGGKKYKVVTYNSEGRQNYIRYLTDENKSDTLWYNSSDTKMEVIECNAPKLTLQMGDYADYFSFYSDANYQKEIGEGDYISGSYLYIKGERSSMEPGKSYRLSMESPYYTSVELSLDNETAKIDIRDREEDVTVKFSEERSLNVLDEIIWNGCESYISVYKDSACKEELKAGDYIYDSIYVKMTTACADGKAVKAVAKQKDSDFNMSSSVYLGRADGVQSIWLYGSSESRLCVLTFELINKPLVHLNIADEYNGKIQFFYEWQGKQVEIKDGTAVTPQTWIRAKCTLGNENMQIPVHMETMQWNGKDQVPGMRREVITGSYGRDLMRIEEDDVTFDVRGGSYLQIIEQNLESIVPSYSYIANEEEHVLTETELAGGLYVPEGAKLKVSASGITDNAEKNILKARKGWNRWSYIYSDEDFAELELTDDEPVYISETPTYEVTVDNQLSAQSSAVLTWNEKEFVSGMRIADGDYVNIEVRSAVTGKSVRITENGNPRYYFKSSEADSGYYELYIEEDTKIGIDEVNLRKVTINQPEGYRIYAGVYFGDDGWEYDFDSETSFEAPEGAGISLEGSWYDSSSGNSDIERSLKIIRRSEKYPQDEGYLFCDDYRKVEVKDEDLIIDFEPVTAYRLIYKDSVLDNVSGKGIYNWDGAIYAASGSEVILRRNDISVSEKYLINAYHTGNPSEKVVENGYLTNRTRSYKFIMPAFPVTIDAGRKEVKSNVVTIKENNFSGGSAVSVKKYNGSDATEPVKSGDEVYEDQLVRVDADSVAQNKKLLVTFKKTGTEEYATGSSKGISIEGIKSAFFEMLGFPVTIDITEKDRKGSGKPVYITESLSGGSSAEYSVESGDYVAKDEEISVDITQVKAGRQVVVNVICPDENLMASGSDYSRAYYSGIVSKPQKFTFKMPDYPIEIQVWDRSKDGKGLDISKAEVRFTKISYLYTGQEIRPEYTVWYESSLLVEGEDFAAEYVNNVQSGTAQIVLKGIGSNKGELRADFEITKRSLLDDAVNIEMSPKVIYNRKAEYRPLPVVTINGFALSKDVDYTLSYQGNTVITDSATVTITGNGSMEGKVERTFAIVEETAELKDENIRLESKSFLYTGDAIEPMVEVYYNYELLDPEVDYSLTYHNNINAKDNAYVKVVGIGSYKGIARAKFEIRPRSFEDNVFQAVVANQKYKKNVSRYEPKPVLVYDGDALTEGTDYEIVHYVNNECGPEAGEKTEAQIIISGHGNYEGDLTLPFSILRDKIEVTKMKLKVQGNKPVYDGNAKTPDVTVTYKGKVLDSDEYKLIYENNVDAGTAKVTVVAVGEYTGSKATSFKIQPKTLQASDYDIAEIPAQEYCGENKPVPSVTDKENGALLTEEKDLSFSYKNNKKVGANATVIMKGKGNYKGKLSKTFEIKPMNFNNYDYSVPDCAYTGSKLKPDIIATSKTTGKYFPLKAGLAVKVKYENNVNVSGDGSRAKVTFQPKNKNFFEPDNIEPKTLEFSVVPCDLEDVTVMPVKAQKYKGKIVKPKLDVRIGTKKLKENKHYKIVVNNERNNAKGIGEVTIVPMSENDKNFTGSKTVTFVIQ